MHVNYVLKDNISCACQAKCYLLYHDDEDGVSHYHSACDNATMNTLAKVHTE